MIFDICQSSIPENAKNVYLVPVFEEVDEIYSLLHQAFPNNNDWNICCFGGYENAIEFVNQ